MKTLDAYLGQYLDLREACSSGSVVAFNSTSDREIVFVLAMKDLDYREVHENGVSFAKITSNAEQHYRVFRSYQSEIVQLADIHHEPYNIHDVQLLSDKRILLVCSRSRYRSATDYDKNGRIYSESNEFLDEILLGDGINTIQASKDDLIWTSYFDEGILGNFGWNDPIGSPGVIAWKPNGEKNYEYQPVIPLNPMIDCYALNVAAKNEVYCYYYTDFPLVKINGNNKKKIADYWQIPIAGSGGFIIHKDMALFLGSYENRDHLYLVRLKNNHQAELECCYSFGNLPPIERFAVRGPVLFTLSQGIVYRLSLLDLLDD